MIAPFGQAAFRGNPALAVSQRVFRGTESLPGGFTVPAGEEWSFDPFVSTTVVVRANVVIAGRLIMRPARPDVVHTLRFEGVDESRFVGGATTVPLATDVGLWVIGAGVLDAQGSPRVGWNRTGNDSTWAAADELVVAPNAKGDLSGFRPFTRGAPVPTQTGPNGVLYPTEVANLTRNVRIEGTPTGRAHIQFLECQRPQTLRYVAIRYMGPQKPNGKTYRAGGVTRPEYEGVLGRYGLHFHCNNDGSRGSLIEGVVVRNTGGQAFVIHESHGMTFRDCVAYDVRASGFWYDPGTATDDLLIDRCAVLGIPNNPGDGGLGIRGFLLGEGMRNTVRGCVAVGLLNSKVNSGGFQWPSTANFGNNVWTFEDNIAHNNKDGGIGVWQNDANPHVVTRFVGYHNGTGISHGAYTNNYTYRDCVTFRNGIELVQHALGGITFERMIFNGDVLIAKHSLPSSQVTRYVNCLISGSVIVNESGAGGDGGTIRFESTSRSTDLALTRFVRQLVLSDITVQNSIGSAFQAR